MMDESQDNSQQQKREQTIMEKMHDLGTNFMFSVSNWSFKSSAPFKKEDRVFYQGKNVNNNKSTYEKNYKELLDLFYNTIWITYRKNFPPLLNEIELKNQKMSDYISDTGWGCMVRVGQMAFAEGLRRHLVEKKNLVIKKKDDLRFIIQGFLDDDEKSSNLAPYSIQKISKLALSEFSLLPGEWYTPIRICYILGLLHNEKQCIEGTQDLKVAVFSSSRPIVFEDFLERMCKNDPARGKHSSLCGNKCRTIQKNQNNCSNQQQQFDHSCQQNSQNKNGNSDFMIVQEEEPKMRLVCPIHHELENSLIVYIVCMIGLESPQSEYLALSLKMMDFKYSLGLIGGRPKKALYFMGRIEEELIFLDPHYVQEHTNERNFSKSSQYETYFCKKFQTMSSKNIDSSFSLMYYLKDLEQLEEFYQFMMGLKREYADHFFMMMEDVEPSYSRSDGRNSSNLISQKNLHKQAEQLKKQQEKLNQKHNFDEYENFDSEYDNQHQSSSTDQSNGDSHLQNQNHKNNNINNNINKNINNNIEDEDYEVI